MEKNYTETKNLHIDKGHVTLWHTTIENEIAIHLILSPVLRLHLISQWQITCATKRQLVEEFFFAKGLSQHAYTAAEYNEGLNEYT